MLQCTCDTEAQAKRFSGHALLYTVYRHHHGLTHEQAVLRINATLKPAGVSCGQEETPSGHA